MCTISVRECAQGPQLTGPDQFDDRFRPDQFHRTRPDQLQDQTRLNHRTIPLFTRPYHFSQDHTKTDHQTEFSGNYGPVRVDGLVLNLVYVYGYLILIQCHEDEISEQKLMEYLICN